MLKTKTAPFEFERQNRRRLRSAGAIQQVARLTGAQPAIPPALSQRPPPPAPYFLQRAMF